MNSFSGSDPSGVRYNSCDADKVDGMGHSIDDIVVSDFARVAYAFGIASCAVRNDPEIESG